jgi:hypothetical protein
MTDDPSRAVMFFGTDEPPAQTRILTAGPLSAELDAGNLRYIRFGGREAIRAISYVVRDEFWGTYNPELKGMEIDEQDGRFTVTYSASCKGDGQSFTYRATITGTPAGLKFEAEGAGDTDFLTNRTGFVVLHGVEGIAGEPVTVEHVDGRTVETEFPEVINPDCPIRDIRALTHRVAPGLTVRCEMTGDTFEMEDQRNWTDASYKTYVRPLSLPHPYTLAAGETVVQAVSLGFEGAAPAGSAAGGGVTVSVGERSGTVPSIGMWVDARDLVSARSRIEALKPLRPAFLSCYLELGPGGVGSAFDGLAELASALDAPLALEVVVPGEDPAAELAGVAAAAADLGLNFAEVAASLASDMGFVMPGTVFPDMKDFDRLFAAARAAFPSAKIGGGNFVYFTELNRKPVPAGNLDYVLHGTSALVHAADDRSVTETIECLPYLFTSIRAGYGDKPHRVSPAGIGSRTSPFGNDPTPNPNAARVTMTDKDPRQRGLLGAAWHLGYVARAAASGVDSLVLGAPVGGFGLIHAPTDYSQPWFDGAGGLYPVFQVMRALYAASGAARLATSVSTPRDVQALAFETEGKRQLWLANLTGEEQPVAIDGFQAASVTMLDAASFTACAAAPDAFDGCEQPLDGPLVLAPYAVARLLS